TGAPIFTTPEILEETGFIIEESHSDSDEDEAAAANAPTYSDDDDDPETDFNEPRIENYSIEELQRTLERLISQENYEEAARVNEILKKKLDS
ncbi:MAG: UvrB/UvrC motif-containing protein, partial [Paramuribaculum sp.]|nr:UvrB/UvrC motif-containing protein [Paramuribaculum sp.]